MQLYECLMTKPQDFFNYYFKLVKSNFFIENLNVQMAILFNWKIHSLFQKEKCKILTTVVLKNILLIITELIEQRRESQIIVNSGGTWF